MLAGHLQTKNGKYYAVLNCRHHNGARFPKWLSTGLPVKKGNKRAAEAILDDFRNKYNEFGELIDEAEDIQVSDTEVSSSKPQTSKKEFQKLLSVRILVFPVICFLRIICYPGSPIRKLK